MNKIGRPLKFNSEKDFQQYLIKNVDLWVNDFFNKNIDNIQEQWYLTKLKKFGSNKPRIDISINTKDGKRIGIEVKNPISKYSELSKSISQLLAYAIIAEENGVPFDELAIITSETDDILIKIIKKYKLPIRLFIVNKDIHYEII